MALQDRLDAFKADFRSGRPPYNVTKERIEIMDRATAATLMYGMQVARPIQHPTTMSRSHQREGPVETSASTGPSVIDYERLERKPACPIGWMIVSR